MRTRSFVATAAAVLVIAACGGGSDQAADSLTAITLITTTSSMPLFEPSDSGSDGTGGDADTGPTTFPVETDPSAAPQTTPPATTAPATTAPETTAPEPTAPETTAPTASADFSLEADGLGAVSFGADADGVITFVTSFLGDPSADTGWVDPFTIGACGGTQLRLVTWDDLQLEFGDVSNIAEGRPHFYAYYYGKESQSTASPAGLETGKGIGVGSSVAQLLQAYPQVQLRSGNEFMNDSFFVNDSLTGRLSGLADPDLVEMVIGGIPCES
ncbi:MAG: hypothetical protein P8O03_10600 [Ilumatobacter sp.]|nr:hypothetical protein [Ilumatobacter sp.]